MEKQKWTKKWWETKGEQKYGVKPNVSKKVRGYHRGTKSGWKSKGFKKVVGNQQLEKSGR